jgi:hypothetical protein
VPLRPEFRWVVLTLGVVAVLLTISALALNKPDVLWRDGAAHCPHCGALVEPGSHRCKECREEYEWTVAPDEDSPISRWSLSPLEDAAVRERVKALGHVVAAEKVAAATGLSQDAARLYLEKVGVGRCGWCGGTGKDLEHLDANPSVCPACLGRERCIACDGDRRIRIGDQGAARAYRHLQAAIADVSGQVPLDAERAEVRRLTDEFLGRWHGTLEATRVVYWPDWKPGEQNVRVVEKARGRIDQVLSALETRR